jgi:hypothetical protein
MRESINGSCLSGPIAFSIHTSTLRLGGATHPKNATPGYLFPELVTPAAGGSGGTARSRVVVAEQPARVTTTDQA